VTLSSQYQRRYSEVLVDTADRLREYIKGLFSDIERVDAVVARAKSPDRFLAKAAKLNEDGFPKYSDPINQIQDQIGARVTVFYLADVGIVKSEAERYFSFIESKSKFPERDSEFGYFGAHMILKLPDDVIDDHHSSSCPEFFELQIKTLFQHAWSEAHHDLGYKAPRPLTGLERRQVAFSAAQAWGADQIFEQLRTSILSYANDDEQAWDLDSQ
jgi:ppGpp synthetase/RelA/SpoT-type nucleotidyltranferase